MLGALCGLCEKFDPEGSGGGDGLSNKEFQGKVLDSMQSQEKKVDQLVQNYDQLDKKTKDAFEDLTKIKNDFSGLDSDFTAVTQSMKKVQLQLQHEQRAAFGDPLQRIANNEEHCRQFMQEVAKSVGHHTKFLQEDAGVGGTYISEDLAAEIYHLLYEFGAWSTLGVRNVGTKTTKYPVSTARPKANFILTEGDPITPDNTKAGALKNLEVEVIAVIVNVTLQLLEDGEYNVAADLIRDMVEAINERADFAFFQGDGTVDGDNGGFTGLFNTGTAVVADAGATVGATKYTDWLKCLTAVAPAVLMRNPKWWINPTILAASLGVKDDNGRPIFLTATEAPTLGGIGSVLGFGVNLVGAAPNTDAASQKVAAFGDPQNYIVAARKTVGVDESDHAYWTELKRSFRGHTRMAGRSLLDSGTAVLSTSA